MSLPETWWYFLDKNGEGRAIGFPIKIKPLLLWTPKKFIFNNGEIKQEKQVPVEKAKFAFTRRACTIKTL